MSTRRGNQNPLCRNQRRYSEKTKKRDLRTPARHDRDRILYSSALKRLVDVTQVVAASDAHVFHNRLTHSIQVGQVGESIAGILLASQKSLAKEVGLDLDVVQAACLAHDLGHPPFGHTAEDLLNKLATEAGLKDGFEGNAQSFRVVTQLAFHSPVHVGLNLTRATLASILKYPWMKKGSGRKSRKWGAYRTEEKDFLWASTLVPRRKEQRTAEAELMDWADDVTYAVHDVEDFYRASRIPLHLLSRRADDKERQTFFDNTFKRRRGEEGVWSKYTRPELEQAFLSVIALFDIDEPYIGTQEHRSKLRRFCGLRIHNFIFAIRLQRPRSPSESFVQIDEGREKQVAMLKELTWQYVIDDPLMATQQHGQSCVISGLFECFCGAADKQKFGMFPAYYQEKMKRASRQDRTRFVIDLIAGMTERQAIAMFQRITGTSTAATFESILQ